MLVTGKKREFLKIYWSSSTLFWKCFAFDECGVWGMRVSGNGYCDMNERLPGKTLGALLCSLGKAMAFSFGTVLTYTLAEIEWMDRQIVSTWLSQMER